MKNGEYYCRKHGKYYTNPVTYFKSLEKSHRYRPTLDYPEDPSEWLGYWFFNEVLCIGDCDYESECSLINNYENFEKDLSRSGYGSIEARDMLIRLLQKRRQ